MVCLTSRRSSASDVCHRLHSAPYARVARRLQRVLGREPTPFYNGAVRATQLNRYETNNGTVNSNTTIPSPLNINGIDSIERKPAPRRVTLGLERRAPISPRHAATTPVP